MTNEQKFLKQSITQRMVGYVMLDRNLPMLEAFKAIYQSPKFALLCDTSTGLYTQSPLYVYSVFK